MDIFSIALNLIFSNVLENNCRTENITFTQFQVYSLTFKKYNQKYALLYTTVMCMISPGLCHTF